MQARCLVVAALLLVGACGGDDRDAAVTATPGPAGEGECIEGDPVTTESGLVVEDLECGDGPEAERGNVVLVHYAGRIEDGDEFESTDENEPVPFAVGVGDLIPGWDEGLLGMNAGGTRKLTIPPELAYGEVGRPGIPPNSTLVFEIELVEVRED